MTSLARNTVATLIVNAIRLMPYFNGLCVRPKSIRIRCESKTTMLSSSKLI